MAAAVRRFVLPSVKTSPVCVDGDAYVKWCAYPTVVCVCVCVHKAGVHSLHCERRENERQWHQEGTREQKVQWR